MLSGAYLSETLPKELWDRYSEIEIDMILAFARRLRDADYTALWETDRLQAAGILREDLERIISKSWPVVQKDLANAFDQAGIKMLSGDEKILQAGVEAGVLRQALPIAESAALAAILTAGYRRTVNAIRTADSVAVNSTLNILDDVFTQVRSGSVSLQPGIETVLADLARRGITGTHTINGRRMELAPYVRSLIVTNVNQTTNALAFARMSEYGCDLLVVSAHAGARPRCFPFQGRVYSISGTHDKFPPWSETSYGEIAGLLGKNCHHFVTPFIEGVDYEPTKEERDPARYQLGKSNEEAYRESQRQRYNERKIRSWKRRASAMKEAGLNSAKAQAKVEEWWSIQRKHVKDTGRTRRYDREKAL